MMKEAILSVLILLLVQTSFAQTRTKFSANEVKDDFKYLYTTLEQSHYNLYAVTPKKTFDKEFQKITNSITDSLTSIQIIRLFQPFLSLCKMAHCNISFPSGLYFDRNVQNNSRLLPLVVTILNQKIIVTDNLSAEPSIEKGDEITSVNGLASNALLNRIYGFLSGEGNEMINTLVGVLTFPRVYWWAIGSQEEFNLLLKNKKGGLKKILVNGMKAAEFEARISKQKSLFNTERFYKIYPNAAYLHPGIFLNNESSGNTSEQNTFKNNEFIAFIDSAYKEIHKAGSGNLIIDLRGNPGGDNSFSDPMIAYFANKPFWFCSEFNVKTSPITKQFWKDVTDTTLRELREQILTKKDGEKFKVSFNYYKPRTDSLRFVGKVYVLIDRYTYSNSVSVAAIILDFHFGQIIGEPTADVASGYGATHEIRLPNSKIDLSYPKTFFVRPNGNRQLKGITPDIKVLDNPFTNKDEILDFTIEYINDKQ